MIKNTAANARAPAKDLLRDNVVFRRAQLHISQNALAERSGVSRTWISRIENANGDVGLDIIDRVASALEIPISALFKVVDEDAEAVDDAELGRRAEASDENFVDARTLLDAVDQAANRPARRYSQRGRKPAVSR